VTRAFLLILALAAAGCGGKSSAATTGPTPPPSDRTFLSFTVEAGFGLPAGRSMELTPDNATFSGFASITGPGFANSVQVTARDGTGATWGLWLAAPQDRQLVAGRYANAANAIQRAAEIPGLTFWNTTIGGCPPATGEFTVLEATFGSAIGAGLPIDRLHATFEQRCMLNGQLVSAVKGEINIPRRLSTTER